MTSEWGSAGTHITLERIEQADIVLGEPSDERATDAAILWREILARIRYA